MSKLQDMFTSARRAQSGSGMGFLGKNRSETKARAAALVVELPTTDAGSAESAIKAGADGLLFTWDGKDTEWLDTLKSVTEAAEVTKASNESVVCGLHITGGWKTLERENLEQLKDQGISYVVLPLQAPASLLALHIKDVDLVVTVPMREGEMYPIFIRNLTAFDTIAAVQLDFGLANEVGKLTIEDMLQYRAVREAVRFPALLNVKAGMSEADAYTLTTLGVQAVVLTASDTDTKTRQQIKALRELLEKVHQDDKDSKTPSLKP
jgi:2-methylisocitrate lyase-like PEP mutase family enzyme